jgi:hypothetical protein|tara:strand:+ start:2490 stop:3005 length:516 start_codon:yes stop_codon:yes gene_type:complete
MNRPTELYAKYDTTCPRPSCDVPIKQGDKIRVYNDKWYHGNCSLDLERKKDKRLQKKARNLNRKSKVTFFDKDEGDKVFDVDVDEDGPFINVAGKAMKDIKKTKKFGPSPVEVLCKDLAIERKKHNIVITALTWYARRSNYECGVEHDRPAIMYDEGVKAREAINRLMDIK